MLAKSGLKEIILSVFIYLRNQISPPKRGTSRTVAVEKMTVSVPLVPTWVNRHYAILPYAT